MKKEYCINCGNANLFEVSRPKFCSGCGKPFNTVLDNGSQHKNEENDDPDESYSSTKFDVKKLKAGVKCDINFQKTTLDDLFANPLAPHLKESFSREYTGPQGDALLKDIAAKCASSREFKE